MADFTLQNFTLQNYSNALIDPETISMVGNSFCICNRLDLGRVSSGGVVAFLVERTNIAFKKIAHALMLIPLIMPGVLKASAWVLLLNPNNGVLNQLWFSLGFKSHLFNDKSVLSMVWVQGISMIPVTFLLLGAAFENDGPCPRGSVLCSRCWENRNAAQDYDQADGSLRSPVPAFSISLAL